MSVVAQPNFEQSVDNNGSDIVTPEGTSHTLFIGADGYFRCIDSARTVEHVLTETGLRIHCGVYGA